jgi:nitrite reductase/ring-hydroxylating ferredoxin subunit
VTAISKIRFFLIITIFAVAVACNKKNDVIPDVTVDFMLDINDPEFVQLNAIGGSVTVDAGTNNWGIYAAGYNGNGIIISRGVDEFYAYDRTCPHDYAANEASVRINIDASGFAKAVCPQCKTSYELISFGTPASGVGRYPLKNYKTSFDGRWIRVWNN